MRGKISPNVYLWSGDPTNADLKALNPPEGALVIDVTTPAVYLKTSARHDNSGFTAISTSTAKIFRGLLQQTGTDAPAFAATFENTFGHSISWSYNGVGDYIGSISGGFTGTLFLLIGSTEDGAKAFFTLTSYDNNTIRLRSYNGSGAATDELLNDTAIEVRSY